ncbi:MAG: penicillin acylase family protein [Halobacteriales archaeon]
MPDVEIRRDDHGVPHVFADDWHDLAYGQGYVHARDRLFQLDVLRHVGRGDSASVLGPSQLPSDVQVTRDLYDREELEALYAGASDRMRSLLDGYAAGVNRGMAELLRERDLTGEFLAVGHLPERWTPVDSVAVGAYMIGYFGTFGGDEVENAIRLARLFDSLGEATGWGAYGDLNRRRIPSAHATSLSPDEIAVDGGEDALDFEAVPDEQLEFVRAAAGAVPWGVEADDAPALTGLRAAQGHGFGSNALLVAGEHTSDGTPLLMGGPQMRYFRPPLIYEVGLHADGVDVTGIGVVGTPSVVIGRTPSFAWTVTSGYDDMVDTVAVRLDPDDRHRYEWGGEWRRMAVERVTHRPSVFAALTGGDRPRGRVSQERAFLEADGHRMPVVAWNPDARVAWAQRTTVRGDAIDALETWALDAPAADTGREAADAFAEIPFSFNYLVADESSIHYVHTGRVPSRDPAFDWRLPVPGRDGLWDGTTHTVADHGMRVTDPDQGYVAQWNNAPVADWRAGDMEQHWDLVHRADRLEAVVQELLDSGPVTFEAVRDVIEAAGRHDPVAMHTAPLFVEAAAGASEAPVPAMAAALEEWVDADCPWATDEDGRHAPGMAVWEATRTALLEAALDGPLGDLRREPEYEPPREVVPGEDRFVHGGDHGRVDYGDVLLVRVLRGEAAHDWLGGDPEAAVREAMDAAADRLTDRFGSAEPDDWRLPERTVKFSPMGALPEVDVPIVHRGTFNHVVAPAAGRAASVLPPANDGHVALGSLRAVAGGTVPEHLEDQLSLYEGFELKPFPVDPDAIAADLAVDERLEVRPPRRFDRLRALVRA